MSQARTARNRRILVLILLLFISFILMGVSQSRITIRFKSVAYGVVYPFQFVGVRSITLVKEFFSSIEKNKQLKQEVKAHRNFFLKIQGLQNELLKNTLDIEFQKVVEKAKALKQEG